MLMSNDAAIATERIQRLHEAAREAARSGKDQRARSHVRRAKRIAQRHRLSLPDRFDRFTCADCGAYLLPGRSARVRTQNGHVVISCDCGSHARYPYDDQ